MSEEKKIKMHLSTFFLLLALIVITIMTIFIFRLYGENEKLKKTCNELEDDLSQFHEQINDLQSHINKLLSRTNINSPSSELPENIPQEIKQVQETPDKKTQIIQDVTALEKSQAENFSNLSETKNENLITKNVQNNFNYTIDIREQVFAKINVSHEGKIISKEFEMPALIANTGIIKLPAIGNVALVAYSGGETYCVNIYQFFNNEIICIGNIDCGADMIKDANYTIESKDEVNAIIKATTQNENITKELKMTSPIADTNVLDIFDLGKIVLIAETGGEYYGIQFYRLSQNYTNKNAKEIKNVGSVKCHIN